MPGRGNLTTGGQLRQRVGVTFLVRGGRQIPGGLGPPFTARAAPPRRHRSLTAVSTGHHPAVTRRATALTAHSTITHTSRYHQLSLIWRSLPVELASGRRADTNCLDQLTRRCTVPLELTHCGPGRSCKQQRPYAAELGAPQLITCQRRCELSSTHTHNSPIQGHAITHKQSFLGDTPMLSVPELPLHTTHLRCLAPNGALGPDTGTLSKGRLFYATAPF